MGSTRDNSAATEIRTQPAHVSPSLDVRLGELIEATKDKARYHEGQGNFNIANACDAETDFLVEVYNQMAEFKRALEKIAACEIEFCEGVPVGFGPPVLSAEQMAAIAHTTIHGAQS